MKTMKQVLAEFQRMQEQLMGDCAVEVRVYKDGNYWAIKLTRSTFTAGSALESYHFVEWTHYSIQDEEQEQKNEKLLAEFKKMFNLK